MSKADNYIQNHKCNTEFKPLFHLSAPWGWINDPNGFVRYKDEWHLFYQYNPYSSKWGRMHWGHAKSKDLLIWEDLPVALAPDNKNDWFLGCFSGSALERKGNLFLMYTGVPFLKQHQILAKSKDGIRFEKIKKPVISSKNRPQYSGKFSFRDPKMFTEKGINYAVIGASYNKGRQIALYESENLTDWKFKGAIKKEDKSKGIFECPDLIKTENGDILIYSIMYTQTDGLRFQNLHSSVFEIGKTDLEKAQYIPLSEPSELDSGADFYAPQTAYNLDGRIVMIAWMQMWFRSNPLIYLKHGYSGIFTLPRELSVKNGELIQKPIREVYDYFSGEKIKISDYIEEEKSYENISGSVYLLKMEFDYGRDLEIKLRKGKDCFTSVKFENDLLTFNRENSGYPIKGTKGDGNCNIRYMKIAKSQKIRAEIFVDKCSVEIFINNKQCMSNTIYPFKDATALSFSSRIGTKVDMEFCKHNEITKIFEKQILNFYNDSLLKVIDRTDGNKHPNMPDIEIVNKIYIECTVALKGLSSDGQTFQMPSSDENNTFSIIPKEVEQAWTHFAHQRLANRLDEKNKKFINNKKNPKFNDKLPRIVAITVDESELSDFYSFDDLYEDALRKLLWDNSSNIKRQFYSDGSWADIPDKDGIEVKKLNGSIVPSGIFNDCKNNYKNISAVIFVSPNKVSQAKKDTKIDKNDIYLCINRFADIKITEDDLVTLGYPKILLEFPQYSH